VFTIPNLISLIRLGLIPVFLWLLFGKDDPAGAGTLFFFIAWSDWIDGYLARRLNQISELGKILDPLADRVAVAVAVVFGWVSGVLAPWFAIALIVRESLVGLAAIAVVVRGAERTVEVRYIGKLATFLVYSAVTWFYWAEGWGWRWLEVLAFVVGTIGLVIYYYVLVDYAADVRAKLAAVDNGSKT
jgi:cardiolipin synthase